MDNAKFSKFAKDMGLLSKSCTKTDVDLIFQRVKLKSERKLQYMQVEFPCSVDSVVSSA